MGHPHTRSVCDDPAKSYEGGHPVRGTRRSRLVALVAVALGFCMAVFGCVKNSDSGGSSSSSTTSSTTSSSTSSKAAKSGGGRIVLVAGELTDPFYGALKKGADDAAKQLGVGLTYQPADISA